jgi:hypothetical protein
MATATDTQHNAALPRIWLGILRVLTVGFGICSIAWAVFFITVTGGDASLSGAAAGILRGESFDSAKLSALKEQLNSVQRDRLRAATLSDAVVIGLRFIDTKATDGAIDPKSPDLLDLKAALVAALSADPNNSFLWFIDYWISRVRRDDTDIGIKSLRMSYAMGPNEAWIAQRRNPVALDNFPSLPPDLAEQALSEFVRLVKSHLYVDSTNILVGPGWPLREKLLSRLAPLPEADRRAIARGLSYRGVDEVSVPGIPNERASRPF